MRAISSVGQSHRLITGRSGVRVPDGPPYFFCIIFRGIAQLVEQRSPKPRAEGSSPSAPAINNNNKSIQWVCYYYLTLFTTALVLLSYALLFATY